MKAWSCLGLLLLTSFGCHGCHSPSPVETPAPKKELSGEDVWYKMRNAYRNASTYRDEGYVTLSYEQAGQKFESRGDAVVRFARPNKIFVRAYQATVACDGQNLRAKVDDENTNNVDNQVVVRPSGDQIRFSDMVADPLLADVMRNAVVTGPWGRYPIQLDLILSEEMLPRAADSKSTTESAPLFRLLGISSVQGLPCHQLQVTTSHGTFLLFVDEATFVVRRLEYPKEVLDQEMVKSPDIKNVKLVAEFPGATFEPSLGPDDFKLDIAPGAKEVRFFVPPPQPLPSELFGKPAPPFALTDLDGNAVTRESMAGKIAALVWFSDDPACAMMLQQLDSVRKSQKVPEQFAFYAICTEPTTMSHRQVRELARQWKVETPILRDLQAYGLESLRILGTPTLVVLDGDGVVQIFEIGANPNLSKQLPEILDRLARGEDMAASLLADAQRERQDYEIRLEAARGNAATTVVELPITQIQPRSDPKHVTLASRWTCTSVTAAGNLLVDEREGELIRILVLDGGRRVVELDPNGEERARRHLPIPENARTTFLRMFATPQGQHVYAASSLLGQKVFLFDSDWNLTGQYPPDDEQHPGIRDVLIADIEADGTPECYVAFWGSLGVHRVSMNGQREWINRTMPSVLSLAVTPANDVGWRKLLAAGETGTILRINQFGNADSPISIPNWSLNQIVAGRLPEDRQTIYCGVSFESGGALAMVALDSQFVHQWDYPLPPGLSRSPIEFITSGMLVDEVGQWVFAAADGSVHIVASDGEFSDYFYYGKPLLGIAASRVNGSGLLLVSTDEGVAAWDVARKKSD